MSAPPLGPADPEPPFSCTTSHTSGPVTRISVRGALDLSTARQLELAVQAATEHASVIVVDLRELCFIDVAGLRSVLNANACAEQHQATLIVVPTPAPAGAVFDLLGACRRLTVLEAPRQLDVELLSEIAVQITDSSTPSSRAPREAACEQPRRA